MRATRLSTLAQSLHVCYDDVRTRVSPTYYLAPFISLSHNMPRVAGSSENTARWNSADDVEFQKLVHRGIIDIEDITPRFIESIRASQERWKTRSASNFRTNYRRVANTLRLKRDLVGTRALRGESCVLACFSFSGIFLQIVSQKTTTTKRRRRPRRRRRQRREQRHPQRRQRRRRQRVLQRKRVRREPRRGQHHASEA